jgi:hypothetical protein
VRGAVGVAAVSANRGHWSKKGSTVGGTALIANGGYVISVHHKSLPLPNVDLNTSANLVNLRFVDPSFT